MNSSHFPPKPRSLLNGLTFWVSQSEAYFLSGNGWKLFFNIVPIYVQFFLSEFLHLKIHFFFLEEKGNLAYALRRTLSCNHIRAYEYFIDSIKSENCQFIGIGKKPIP